MSLLRFIAVTLLTASPALLSFAVVAAPLDKEACDNLKLQQEKLLTREVREALVRGPDWVKTHLDPEKIEQVRKYLTVEESVMFRCRPGALKIVWPPPPPLPDRKPAVPVVSASKAAAADAPAASAVADTGTPLPDRKPVFNTAAETKASQALADSDKTAASQATP